LWSDGSRARPELLPAQARARGQALDSISAALARTRRALSGGRNAKCFLGERRPTLEAGDCLTAPGTCPAPGQSTAPALVQPGHARASFLSIPPFRPPTVKRPPASCPIRASPCWLLAGCRRRSIPQCLSRLHSIAPVAPRRLPASKLISRLADAPPPSAPSFPAIACRPTGLLFLKGQVKKPTPRWSGQN
jgi:hypothetical protein